MFGETVACDDGVTFCNISVVWRYAEEDCVELTNCPLWPCETKKCTHTIVPTPTYCQESQCWTNDKPIGPVVPNDFPWVMVCSIIGSVALVGFLVTLGWFKRKTRFMQGFIGCLIGFAFGCLALLILLVFPFVWTYQYFKAFFEMVYGNIRYRNEPENPRRRTSIELDEIKESLRNNGCWPFVPSGPILLETDDSDEDNNSSIVINQAAGTSEASTSSGTQKPNLTIENEKPSKGKGKGKGKGKQSFKPREIRNAVAEEHERFIPPKADLSNFSAYDSEDEVVGRAPGRGHFIEDAYVPDQKS